MPPIVVVTGISGVGKSWMLDHAFGSANVQILSASKLISAEIGRNADLISVAHDQLRERDIDANQRALSDGFARSIDLTASAVALDAHVAIDTPEGLTLIPAEVFERIAPDLMVFVSGDTKKISAQRQDDLTRRRPSRSPLELSRQQTATREWAKELAQHLGISFITVASGDIDALTDTLTELQDKI